MFIPFYIKSNYSLLSSMLKIDDIIDYSLQHKLPFCFLTDNNMYGAMEFYQKCQKSGLRPILGLEILIEDSTILVYAKNYQGYKSMIKLSTIQNERKI